MAHVTATPDFSNGIGLAQQINGAGAMYLSSLVEISLRDHGLMLSASEAFRKFGAEEDKADRVLVGSTVDYFIELCVNERLVTYGQTIGGGAPFEAIPSIEWTRDEAVNWFVFCHNGHDPVPPMRLKRDLSAGERPLNIFVERTSLDDVLRVIGDTHPFTPDPLDAASWRNSTLKADVMANGGTFSSLETQKYSEAYAEEDISILDRIRSEGGISKLTGMQKVIWQSILSMGGEEKLPQRAMERNQAIREHAKGRSSPSDRSIERFFERFKPT